MLWRYRFVIWSLCGSQRFHPVISWSSLPSLKYLTLDFSGRGGRKGWKGKRTKRKGKGKGKRERNGKWAGTEGKLLQRSPDGAASYSPWHDRLTGFISLCDMSSQSDRHRTHNRGGCSVFVCVFAVLPYDVIIIIINININIHIHIFTTNGLIIIIITSCAARWSPQYAPAPWPWLLTFWPWSRCGSRMWPGVPLCKVSSS